ncbi:4-(cytidine 5'-diphospho)-2-C-methyl-D-erythritol kinase [Candidatus Pelagibacter sp.]|nr:4-(cytidine 5'-diphospho)-2-C-methyl-D-erythritol kinase [Candidatus Pelagibacter sp.]
MKFHKIKSFAKVNLTLKILNKYSNGYHKIESLISKINLADEILIKETQGSKNRISFSGKFSSNISNTNTISKLLKILNDQNYIKNKKFNIKVKKNIPQSSGMGGGSMNAASILNYLFKKRIIKTTKNNLIKIANKVGSDVILGLYESPMILQGQNISKINKKLNFHLLIIKPNFGCSTKMIYAKHRGFSKSLFYKLNNINRQDLLKVSNNDLETAAFNKYPILRRIKSYLQNLDNIYFANMTGSGSTIIGYFLTKNAAIKAQKKLKNKYKNYWCIYSKTI